jgi:3-phosphoshikimate 1-carboxyvinyltransferase
MNYSVKCIYGDIKNKKATVSVVGSKSITARALLLATLAEGTSILYGVQFSDDCNNFLNAVKALGIGVEVEGTTVKISGCGGKLPVESGEIYVGSAGTAARFLTALLAFSKGKFTITSSDQMKKRPLGPLVESLKQLGAKFTFLENQNCFPFIIEGTNCPSDSVSVDISKSSQFLSALLISAVCAPQPMHINVVGDHGMDYVNMTLDMMWSFGVNAEVDGNTYVVGGKYAAKRYDIEPDVSAACYFYAMNRILGTDIKVNGIMPHTMQGDYKFIQLIKNFNGGRVDMSAYSDQALTLAAVAPYLDNPTTICNIAHVRGQECDRINAIVTNLTAMGVKCDEFEDGVTIYPSTPHGAVINTFGDHRVAMSFAICGMRTQGIIIENAEVCAKTFKEYFEVLDNLTKSLIQ